MVDDSWQTTEVPNIVEIDTDGNTEGLEAAATQVNNQDHNVVRPGVEFVPETGFVAVNGNGHSPVSKAKATESQRTLLSGAEFMAEPPAKRRVRAGNVQTFLSLFEWAVAMEEVQKAWQDNVAASA